MLATRTCNRFVQSSVRKQRPYSSFSSSSSFIQRWFNIPKGFKKFYPKERIGGGTSTSSTGKEGAKKAKDKGSEGKRCSIFLKSVCSLLLYCIFSIALLCCCHYFC